jgi:hypothetical protein
VKSHSNGEGTGAWLKPDPAWYYSPPELALEFYNGFDIQTTTAMIRIADSNNCFRERFIRLPPLGSRERIVVPVFLEPNGPYLVPWEWQQNYQEWIQRYWRGETTISVSMVHCADGTGLKRQQGGAGDQMAVKPLEQKQGVAQIQAEPIQ